MRGKHIFVQIEEEMLHLPDSHLWGASIKENRDCACANVGVTEILNWVENWVSICGFSQSRYFWTTVDPSLVKNTTSFAWKSKWKGVSVKLNTSSSMVNQ